MCFTRIMVLTQFVISLTLMNERYPIDRSSIHSNHSQELDQLAIIELIKIDFLCFSGWQLSCADIYIRAMLDSSTRRLRATGWSRLIFYP